MSDESFDPYTRLLGLSAGPRPPSYYELLELETFCSHPERIDQAVRKQFRIIKTFQDHPDRPTREAVQDIMNEIARARVVLTDPARKEAYDQALARERNIDREACLAERVAAPLPEFCLTVIAGPSLVGRCVELVEGTTCTIGSDVHCTVSLRGGRAADRHCTIEFTGGEWLLRARDAAPAVAVNGVACRQWSLSAMPADDRLGDHIDVGGYRLRFCRVTDLSTQENGGAAALSHHAAPPLSMIVLKGPSDCAPMFNALPPQRIIVGHADTALWQLPERSISAHHFAVQTVGDDWELEDLNSKNGTDVNGTEVLRHIFNDRDVITVGPFDIMVSLRA